MSTGQQVPTHVLVVNAAAAVSQEGPVSGSGAAGTSTSTNVCLTRRKSTLFQWLAVPLWVPTGKDSVPTDSGAFRSQFCGRQSVNAATGRVDILRYLIVEDCGTVLNVHIVEGQHHGLAALRIAG